MPTPSKTTLPIAGIPVHVYGLSEFRAHPTPTFDLAFLLHGRTRTYTQVEPWAQSLLAAATVRERGLLVVAFDARNHGERMVSGAEARNLAWKEGNATHGQDMYSFHHGISQDVSLLVDFLPVYLFPHGEATLAHILCGGFSLGGRATYHVLSNDPRIKAGIPIAGCPQLRTSLDARAGPELLSTRLPPAFRALVARLDPVPAHFADRDLLVLHGEADDKVVWEGSVEFLEEVRGVQKAGGGSTEVVLYPGVGHELTGEMLGRSAGWVDEWRKGR